MKTINSNETGKAYLVQNIDYEKKQLRGFKLDRETLKYKTKVNPQKSNIALRSDDSESIEKLQKIISDRENYQEFMRNVNRIARNKKLTHPQKIKELGFLGISEESSKEILLPDCFSHIGFSDFELSNNLAIIRKYKKRMELLINSFTERSSERIVSNLKIVDNVEENRIQLFFREKPSLKVVSFLKRNGFKWSLFLGCWQRFRGEKANLALDKVLKYIDNQ
jgi:hypothetical protein